MLDWLLLVPTIEEAQMRDEVLQHCDIVVTFDCKICVLGSGFPQFRCVSHVGGIPRRKTQQIICHFPFVMHGLFVP